LIAGDERGADMPAKMPATRLVYLAGRAADLLAMNICALSILLSEASVLS
jgi:hypothetical protein